MNNHPVFEEMLRLGCNQQVKIAIAFQVYMDLSEAHLMWDISYRYNKELDLIFFMGRTSKSSPLEIYVPVPAKSNLTISHIEDLQRILCNEELKAITLAIKDKDSTVVLYRLQEGLVTPEAPEDTKRKKQLKDNRFNVESELRRNKESIFMRAQGIDIPSEEPENDEEFAGEL